MIIPCIDLMDGKVVQLVQGRDKALEGGTPEEMLARFAAFPVIQVIDLDAALGRGSNDALVEFLCAGSTARVGGGVRASGRARRLLDQGADKVIVGTAAFRADGINRDFLAELSGAVDPGRILIALDSKDGRIVVKGWRQAVDLTADVVDHHPRALTGERKGDPPPDPPPPPGYDSDLSLKQHGFSPRT